MYETFDHTADLGLRALAAKQDELFVEMAKCLFSTVVEDFFKVEPAMEFDLEIEGADKEYLLFDWLRELLYRCESDGLVFSEFQVRLNDNGLSAKVRGEPLNADKHGLGHEVKAITYHELKVEQTPAGWVAEVIVDI